MESKKIIANRVQIMNQSTSETKPKEATEFKNQSKAAETKPKPQSKAEEKKPEPATQSKPQSTAEEI